MNEQTSRKREGQQRIERLAIYRSTPNNSNRSLIYSPNERSAACK
jgi:hypothetical protein